MVKFYVTDLSLVPPGIPRVDRHRDWESDQRHARKAIEMGQAEKAEEGRARKKRTDTGKLLIRAHNAQLGILCKGLANRDFIRMTACHYFVRIPDDPKRGEQYVICITFRHTSDSDGKEVTVPNRAIRALRTLARYTWSRCDCWDNELENTITINSTGPLFKQGTRVFQDPKNAVVVRNGQITTVKVERAVEETEE